MIRGTCTAITHREKGRPVICGEYVTHAYKMNGAPIDLCDDCGARFGLAPEPERPAPARLDWSDRDEVRRFVLDLRVACEDIDAVVMDLLRPPSKRELGPALARDNYAEAFGKVGQLLGYAMPDPEPENGDPSGSGGAGPTL
jgi:hypothetical protein